MKFALFATAAALFGVATASPIRGPSSIAQRDINVLGVRYVPRELLPAYQAVKYADKVKRDHLDGDDDDDLSRRGEPVVPNLINRQDVNTIPEEDPVKSDGTGIVNYVKKVKRDDGDDDILFRRGQPVTPKIINREADAVIAEEIPTKSDGNGIEQYDRKVKRDDEGDVDVDNEDDEDEDDLVKRDNLIPAEFAVKSDGIDITQY